MGDSAAFLGAGLAAIAPGAPGAGPFAGGGASGPVDCAARVAAKSKGARRVVWKCRRL